MTKRPAHHDSSTPTHSASDGARPARSLPWLLIVGLSSLSLLWPLTALWPIAGTGAVRAFIILGLTGAIWVSTVGFGRVPRPVLTLTLAGLGYGFLELALGAVISGGGGPFGTPWALIPALGIDAGVGALAGLAATGIQAALGSRGDR